MTKASDLPTLKAKAEAGDAEAQYQLGQIYANGLGLEQDYAEAAKWYRMAADQNNPWAQFKLGLFYANGHGVKKHSTEALKWHRRAATQGNAQVFQRYADQGDAEAQYWLSSMYIEGTGVKQDYAEGLKWLRLSAEQGHPWAKNELGNPFAPPKFLLKDVCPAIVNELVKYFESKGAEDIVSQLARTMVCAQLLAGHPENFSFLAYPVPGLTRMQREAREVKVDEERVNIKLGKANIRIDFDPFDQISWFYVTDVPEMHAALQNALKA